MTAAMRDEETQDVSPKKKRPAKKSVAPVPDLPAPEQVSSPYPEGVEVYSYQPEDKSAQPILLPLSGYEQPSKVWLWDVSQLTQLGQTWQWLLWAKVPKDIIRQAQALEDSEYFAMFNKWFEARAAYARNEPKGAVTAGK